MFFKRIATILRNWLTTDQASESTSAGSANTSGSVQVKGLGDRLTDGEVESLKWAVVSVPVGGTIPPEGLSWADIFRFARVTAVSRRGNQQINRCSVCENDSCQYELEVDWESGFQSDFGNLLCEKCVDGVVQTGVECISFGDAEMEPKAISVSTSYDLT